MKFGIKRQTSSKSAADSGRVHRSRRRVAAPSGWLLVAAILGSVLLSGAFPGAQPAYAAQNRSAAQVNPNAVVSWTVELPQISATTNVGMNVTSSSAYSGTEKTAETRAAYNTGDNKSAAQASSSTLAAAATVRLHFDIPSSLSAWWCTGFMVGPSTVATVGHCVYDESGGWAESAQVYLNGSTTPLSDCGVTDFWTVAGWDEDFNWNYDYGAVVLNCNLGDQTGWFGLTSAIPSKGEQSIMNGYPHHVVAEQSYSGKVKSWTYVSFDGNARDAGELNTTDVGAVGSSGGPMWNNRPSGACGGPCAIAIDSHVENADPSSIGTLLTKPEVANYISWGAE